MITTESTYALARVLRMRRPNRAAVRRSAKAQQALDFMVSYGIALLIIAIALYVVMQLGTSGFSSGPQSCTPTPPFLCISYAINTTGAALIRLVQASGGTITINGMACSTAINATNSSRPAYGNVHVLGYSVAPSYYPNNALNGGVTVYSGGSARLSAYCYGLLGVASSGVGNSFNGYIWINYTSSALPQTHIVSMVAQFNARYS